jgi:hypothetical protein
MDINQAQAKIRARSPWEAIDLGLVLAREWFIELWLTWLMLAVPVWLVAHLLFYDLPWLAALLFWWLKPVYEQPLLYIVSRRLFGESVARKELRQRLFRIIQPQLFANLTWRRLNLSRSFNNPVAMLEGQSGQARKQRLRLLHRQQSISGWLTIIGAHIEGILNLSFMALVALLIPSQLEWLDMGDFFIDTGAKFQLASWIGNIGYLLALSLVAPFYVSAGFALYIYTRVRLEAWEIEIAFRSIRNRLDSMKSSLATLLLPSLVVLALLTAPNNALAQSHPTLAQTHSASSSQQLIGQVLQHEDFGRTVNETQWRLRPSQDNDGERSEFWNWLGKLLHWLFADRDSDTDGLGWNLAQIVEFVLWIAAAAALILGLWYLWPYLKGLRWPSRDSQSSKPSIQFPVTELSERLSLHELPDDIMSEVDNLVQQQRIREAVSLLYRGALRFLISQRQLDIPASATERDCLTLVSTSTTRDETAYFGRLTNTWLKLAYAHQPPDAQSLDDLASQWARFYGAES